MNSLDADNDVNRPSPDDLLKQFRREGKGRLRIFLGAAPGVGKTYSMLTAARLRQVEGVDVVIGVVETHGRKDTMAMSEGFEVVPLAITEYSDKTFREMDLDALLKRRPKLAIVDELAHTNIPGSRHTKRYQDVEEILEAGIDVYTTLNIQHLESLNDVIAQISGVTVRETIPDQALDIADEIDLIDISPRELRKRLEEGKVYVPDQARHAINHFFSEGNLTALREMAMRYAAERVDSQMLSYMRVHGIQGIWPTSDRLMVCVGPQAGAMQLVRNCSKIARRRHIPWTAVSIETAKTRKLPEKQRNHINAALRLAEDLGGESVILNGHSVLEELVRFARERKITSLVIGKSQRPMWQRRLLKPALSSEVQNHGDAYEVLIVPLPESIDTRPALQIFLDSLKGQSWVSYVMSTGVVALAVVTAEILGSVLQLANLSLVFLGAVIFAAVRFGLWPSIYTTLLSFIAYNFFFIQPYYTLSMSSTEDILTALFFLVVGMITSNMASRLKDQIQTSNEYSRRVEGLFEFSKVLAGAASTGAIADAAVFNLSRMIEGHAAFLKYSKDRDMVVLQASHPQRPGMADVVQAAADWAYRKGEPAGYSTETLPGSPWYFVPVMTEAAVYGVIGIRIPEKDWVLTSDQRRLVDSITHQTAIAIERAELTKDVEDAWIYTETEKLRSALLTSISHDFRTPLSAIIGSVTSLKEYGPGLDQHGRDDLMETIHEESERLNHYVQNLLDITRFGSGHLTLRNDWVDIGDMLNSAKGKINRAYRQTPIIMQIDADVPLIQADQVLMEQVFINLIDNACKFGPPMAPVTLHAARQGDRVIIDCIDQGVGIPQEEREKVFDMFYRVHAGDRHIAGTGLGLSICKGIVEAHKGTISIHNGEGGKGTRMSVSLPVGEAPALMEDQDDEAA